MIILLHGEDDYRIHKKLEEIISGYKNKNETGINIEYLDRPSFRDLKDESRQMGMFKEKKLLIGKEVLSNNVKEQASKHLSELAKSDNILILVEKEEIKGDLPKQIADLDKDKGRVKKYQKLEGKNLKAWYKKELHKYELEFTSSARKKLVKYIGNNLWRAHNEIQKLALMNLNSKISQEDVIEYVRPDLEVNVFDAIDALGKGDKEKATELLHEHLRQGDSPFYLYSMINYQLRNLITVKDLEKGNLSWKEQKKQSQMRPFVFKKVKSQAENFSFPQIKKLYQKLFLVDLKAKTGELTPETGLASLIAQF